MLDLFQSRGPVVAAFGRHLADRPDLLGARRCRQLASISDRAEPAPFDEVRELLASELRRPVEEVFAALEAGPLDSRLLFQWHAATLASGEAVIVKVVRPGIEARVEPELGLLPGLRRELAPARKLAPLLDEALVEFGDALRAELDLATEAEALEDLAADAGIASIIRQPTLHRRLCTRRVLVQEDLRGVTLSERLAAGSRRPPRSGAEPEPTTTNERLARRLCRDWLRLALLGDLFPLAPWGRNLLVLPGGRPSFVGGRFDRPSRDFQAHLFDYLAAVADERPERADQALRAEMRVQPAAEGRDLRFRFRHAVAFRDADGDDDGLAGTLLVHWRDATELGYRGKPSLLRFLNSLLALARQARRLSPDRDPLLPALQEVRIRAALDEARRMVADGELSETLGRQAAVLIELPAKLDRALNLLAERAGSGRKRRRSAAEGSKRDSWAALAGLLLVLASLVLLLHHLGAAGALSSWIRGAGAVAVLLLGGLVLRVAGRSRDRGGGR